MTAPDPRLGEIETRLEAATPGPWQVDECEIRDEDFSNVVGTVWPHGAPTRQLKLAPAGAAFIAAAPFLMAPALSRILELHSEDLFRGHLSNGCRICGNGDEGYPCLTVKTIHAALTQ